MCVTFIAISGFKSYEKRLFLWKTVSQKQASSGFFNFSLGPDSVLKLQKKKTYPTMDRNIASHIQIYHINVCFLIVLRPKFVWYLMSFLKTSYSHQRFSIVFTALQSSRLLIIHLPHIPPFNSMANWSSTMSLYKA